MSRRKTFTKYLTNENWSCLFWLVQRLPYHTPPNEVGGVYADENDKLFLFCQQWRFDSSDRRYRETLFVMSKEKGGEWSQPEKIGNPSYDDLVRYQGGIVGYDSNTGQIHIFCDCGDTLYHTSFRFELFPTYPNPFNAVTRIQYTVSRPTPSTLLLKSITF
jgi:hypothetical protein